MPFNLQQFSITHGAGTATISGLVVDAQTGAVIHDATGANAVTFPAAFAAMPLAKRQDFLDRVVRDFIAVMLGL